MGILLIFAVVCALVTTFFCALTEAALYSVPYAFVKHLADQGSRSGKVLLGFKEEMSNPITAILVLNTIGAVLGSALVGAFAGEVFGGIWLGLFGVIFALTTLYFAEIAPKILGVTFCKPVSVASAIPLSLIIFSFSPLIWVTKLINRALSSDQDTSVTEEEVLSLAAIGTEEGTLDSFEGSVISNVIELDKLLVRDILTPRVVVFRLSEETKIQSLRDELPNWSYTRVPLHVEGDSDNLHGYVIQRDVYREIVAAAGKDVLKEIARPLVIVPEVMRADQLLLQMFAKKEHICGVVDEHGSFVGVITLEDIIEEIIGQEIVDEYDKVSDMRSLARVLRMAKARAYHERKRDPLVKPLIR